MEENEAIEKDKPKRPSYNEIIEMAVERAIAKAIPALYVEMKKKPDDYYKATIHRLDALPVLIDRVDDNKDKLQQMDEERALPQTSKSIVKYQADGVRADPLEMFDAVRQSLVAHIAMDEEEIEVLQKAMEYISGDAYYEVVRQRFMEKKSDFELAEFFACDETTIRRNRSRLVRIISVILYGVPAVNGDN